MPNRQQTTQTTVQNNDPWKAAQPYMTGAMQGAQNLLNTDSGFNPYQGQMVADLSGTTQAGLNQIEQTASAPNPMMQTAYQGLMGAMDPSRITGGSPEFLAAQNYQAGQMADDVNRGFSASGRYGSGAHAGVLGQEIGQFRNQGLASEIGRQQQLQMQAFGMAPGMAQAQYLPGQMMLQAGNVRDAQQQDVLNAEMERYSQQDMEGWNRLNAYNSVVGPYGGMGGTSTQTTSQPRGMPVLRTLAGLGMMGLSALSDRRAKTDISRVGETDDGQNIYVYRYKGSPTFQMGMMADEVAEKHPEAVSKRPDGLLQVNYRAALEDVA
jgi:hypothetical protein